MPENSSVDYYAYSLERSHFVTSSFFSVDYYAYSLEILRPFDNHISFVDYYACSFKLFFPLLNMNCYACSSQNSIGGSIGSSITNYYMCN